MKCAACYNEMVKKKGEVDLRIEGKLYLVRNIINGRRGFHCVPTPLGGVFATLRKAAGNSNLNCDDEFENG